jgi:LysM repeat protein
MARRQPTRPDWENPPHLDSFPRLRARDDRSGNQPLMLLVMAITAIMVGLIVVPLLSGNGGGTAKATPTASGSGQGQDVPTDTPLASPTADRTLMVYVVTKKDKSLSQIAIDHGIPLTLLEAANPISSFPSGNYNIIYPGMQIFIPWQTWTPQPIVTPTPAPTPTPKATPTPAPTPSQSGY